MSSHSDIAPERAVGPSDDELLSLGKLHFLAGFCPVHKHLSAMALARIFHPALSQGCVRFFENDMGKTAAALIWARLSDTVSERLLRDRIPPTQDEWTSGSNLWFLDLIAPFGQGLAVAKHIARSPPEEPFYFARLDAKGHVRKVVRGDGTVVKGRIKTWHRLPGSGA